MNEISNNLVSVVMSAYNHAHYVGKAIESVLTQSHQDIEFLITDDGSSDGSVDEIKKYSDSRIKFYSSGTNMGACKVLNDLISRAQGEFVCIINSDDKWCEKDKIKKQLKILQEKEDVGAVFGLARYIDNNECVLDKKKVPHGNIFDQENRSRFRWLEQFFMHGNCLCHPTAMIRKKCYEQLGGYRNIFRQLPDLDMWIRVVKNYEIHILQEELVEFRILFGENASSATEENLTREFNEFHIIRKSFFEGIKNDDIISGFINHFTKRSSFNPVSLSIEKALIYFNNHSIHSDADKIIGIEKMILLLEDSDAREILKKDYGIDDLWIHRKMSECKILCSQQWWSEADADKRLEAIKSSMSWKITMPLRFARDNVGEIINKCIK